MSESRPLLTAANHDAPHTTINGNGNGSVISNGSNGSNGNGNGRVSAITPPNSHFARPRSRSLPIITREPPRKRWYHTCSLVAVTIINTMSIAW